MEAIKIPAITERAAFLRRITAAVQAGATKLIQKFRRSNP